MTKVEEEHLISLGYIDIEDHYELSLAFNEIFHEWAICKCSYDELIPNPKKEYLTEIGIEVFARYKVLETIGIPLDGLFIPIWKKVRADINENKIADSKKVLLEYQMNSEIRKENYLEAEKIKKQINELS